MHLVGDRLVFAATDLSNFLACPHLSGLARAVTLGERPKPRTFDDPGTEVLKRRGLEHEARFLAQLREEHGSVVTIAERLNIDQPNVSRLENRSDVRVSTLADYVAALGGRLEILAVFPEGTVRINQFERSGKE